MRLFLNGSLALLIVLFLFVGCGVSQYSQKTVNGVTITSKDGVTSYSGDPDKVAAYKARVEVQEQAKAARVEQIKTGPKRKAGEPITVALFETEIGANLAKNERARQEMYNYFYRYFGKDAVIRLIDKKKMLKASKRIKEKRKYRATSRNKNWFAEARSTGVHADVYVYSWADLKESVGINRRTKKAQAYAQYVIRAKMSSRYLFEEFSAEEKGHFLKNEVVSKKLVAKIKQLIQQEIRPTLPALSASKASKRDLLKSLFKKK